MRQIYSLILFLTVSLCLSFEVQGAVTGGRLSRVADGYSATSVNTAVFRANSITSHGDTQYCCFYNPEGYVTVARRKRGTDSWEVRQTQYKGNVSDAHNVISMAADGDGYLHLSFDHHGHPLRYCRSIAPDTLAFDNLEPMIGVGEEDVTYPEFHNLADGNLIFVYRSGASGKGNMVMNRYDITTRKWERIHDVLIDGEGKRNAYWQLSTDSKGTIHLSWVWRETWLVETNHDLCYARSDDGGKTWKRSDGSVYSLPITIDNAEIAWHIPQNSELINQTSMTAEDNGNPFIATYWREAGDSVPQYRLVSHDGKGWKMEIVGHRHSPFSLSGGGTKMIPISRPQVVSDGNIIYYVFRDAERGSKVSVATRPTDGKLWTVTDITDFSVDAWEPTFDKNYWCDTKRLILFVQKNSQGDGEKVVASEPTPVYALEVITPLADVRIKNKYPFPRNGEMVEIPDVYGTDVCLTDDSGMEIPIQRTYDGKIIFQVDMEAGAERIFRLCKGKATEYPPIVYGRLFPERADDMTWENDRCAYRAYGPALQRSGERAFGYDIWTKSVTHPVIEQRYADHMKGKSFHVDHGEGMDVYSVGPTLGAGTAAIIGHDGQPKYSWCFERYRILDRGPLRFTVQLDYPDQQRIISLDAGSYFNRTIVNFRNTDVSDTVAAGIVLHHPLSVESIAEPSSLPAFFATGAGITMAGYADPTDNPAGDNGEIFVGVLVPDADATTEILPFPKPIGQASGHILVKSSSHSAHPYTYYWGAGWSKAGINGLDDWTRIIAKFAKTVSSPLEITIMNKN